MRTQEGTFQCSAHFPVEGYMYSSETAGWKWGESWGCWKQQKVEVERDTGSLQLSLQGCDRTPAGLGDLGLSLLRRLLLAGEPDFLTSLYIWLELKQVKLLTCSFVLSSASETRVVGSQMHPPQVASSLTVSPDFDCWAKNCKEKPWA